MEATDFENYMPSTQATPSITTETMVGRQMQEVKAMVFMAKQFPRNPHQSWQRIMAACERKALAESASYEFPRGTTKVTGPSIRLAEVVAQNWGNIDFGVVELEQKAGESTAMAYCWDLETNVRQTKIFVVRHERYTKASGIQKLTDPRDIYEMVANQGARRLRACILGVIPGDVIDKALERCNKTLIGDNSEPFEDRLNKVLEAYQKEFGVGLEPIEKYFGYYVSAFTEMDLVKLKKIGLSIRDGMAKREDYFDIRITNQKGSSLEEEFKKEGGVVDTEQTELPLTGSK